MIRWARPRWSARRPAGGCGPATCPHPRTGYLPGGGWHAIALMEAGKGVLALVLAALGAAWHRMPSGAPRLVSLLMHSPAFVPASWIAFGTAYALLRFVEAYGLWRRRRWAALLGVASCLAYLPIEAWELHAHPGWGSAGALAITVVVLLVLAGAVATRRAP